MGAAGQQVKVMAFGRSFTFANAELPLVRRCASGLVARYFFERW